MMHFWSRLKNWLIYATPLREPSDLNLKRLEPQEIDPLYIMTKDLGPYLGATRSREAEPECDHCSCYRIPFRCCYCRATPFDAEPVEVRGREVILNPKAMEYGARYGFTLAGPNQPRMWVVRNRDESLDIYEEQPCTAVETVVEDCSKTYGFLSEGVLCGVYTSSPPKPPLCEYHRKLYWRPMG